MLVPRDSISITKLKIFIILVYMYLYNKKVFVIIMKNLGLLELIIGSHSVIKFIYINIYVITILDS